MRRMLEDPVLRARYFQLVLEAVNAASSGDWLVREVTNDYQQIRDSVLADPFKPYTDRGVRRGIRRAARVRANASRRSSPHRFSKTGSHCRLRSGSPIMPLAMGGLMPSG